MAGLINNKLDDPVLQAAEQELEGRLLPEIRGDYKKVVVAGMQAGLHGGPNSILAGLKNKSKDPVHDAAAGAVGLVLLLRRMSPAMPLKAMIFGGMTLMFHALDFADRAGAAKVGPDELDRATHVYTNLMMAHFKLTPQVLQQLAGKVHGIMQDPSSMDLIARRTGVVRDPRASLPTEHAPAPDEGTPPKGLINAKQEADNGA